MKSKFICKVGNKDKDRQTDRQTPGRRTSLAEIKQCSVVIHLMTYNRLHGRPQAWARGGGTCPISPGKVVKYFDALVMTVKCLVDQLFLHYFQNIRRLLGDPSGLRLWTPLGDESLRPPNLPTPGKIMRASMAGWCA